MEDSPIVLIRISEADIRRFGHPLKDSLLNRVLEQLLAAEPRAIGVDLYRDSPVPPEYDGFEIGGPSAEYLELGETVTSTGRVVMVMKFLTESSGGAATPSWIEGNQSLGFSDFLVDRGGIVRRGLLYLWDEETAYVSFALQLAIRYLQPEGIEVHPDPDNPNFVQLGETTIPPLGVDDGGYADTDDRGYQFLLDYRRGANAFHSFSLGDALAGAIPTDALRDKIVIVGTTAESVKDHFFTPYSQAIPGRQEIHGISLHAHTTDQLVRLGHRQSQPTHVFGTTTEAFWILCWSLLGAAMGLWRRSPWWTAPVALGGLALLAALAYALFTRDWWIPVVPPAFAGVASAGLVTVYVVVLERTERREITGLFSRFLRPRVADEIWRQRDQFMSGDEPGRPRPRWVTLTTLMLDLEGYTSASERMDPLVLMSWVNEFTNAMAELVDRHGGVVDDYFGDGLKANFGFPAPSSDAQVNIDAENAVRCALAMGAKMEHLNASWERRALLPGRLRIGITSGPTVIGVVGGDQSLKFTSIGNSVNTASRLESFDKEGFSADSGHSAWRVLIGEETLRRVEGFRTLDLGIHKLKGKQEPIRVYQVLGGPGYDDSIEEIER